MNRKLKIVDLIGSQNAILPSFGERVFEAVEPILEQGEGVILDFSGLRNASTSFFHASVGALREAFPQQYDQLVSTEGLTYENWLDKYDEAIELACNPRQQEDIRRAMDELIFC